MASETGYVPLPTAAQARALGSLRQVRGTNDAPLNFISGGQKSGSTQIGGNRTPEITPANSGS